LVNRVTTEGSADYVPPAERFAVFDMDGTLLTEHPYWLTLEFAFYLARERVAEHPEWKNDPFISSILEGNPPKTVTSAQWRQLTGLVEANMERQELRAKADYWMAHGLNHEGKPFRQLIFQPMKELMEYLRANDFKTWISTGTWDTFSQSAAAYFGVPSYQVLSAERALELKEDREKTYIVQLEQEFFPNMFKDKVLGLERVFAGIRPIIVAGNTNNDMAMMTWSADRDGASLQLLIIHDDEKREALHYAGDEVLKRAAEHNWLKVSVRDDWKVIFPEAK